MTVIWTGALASARAAFKPPNPAPTITTRGIAWLVILLSVLHLYKIQPDGRGFQKFSDSNCALASPGDALRGRHDFCRPVECACVHQSISASARGCRNRMAHSDGPADSGDACHPTRGFVFFHHGKQAMVRLGVALRLGCGAVGSHAGIKRSGLVYGSGDRSGFCMDVSFAHPT